MAGSSLIGRLAVDLTMNTAAFQRGATIAEKRAQSMQGKFSTMSKSMIGMGAALGGAFIVGGLTSAASSAFELGSSLSEAAEKMGVTVEGLQRLRVAARETGVSNEQLDASMAKLNKSLGDLQLGTKSATDAFAQIGLSADDLRGKRPDEALRLIADQLNKIPDQQQRIAIGSQLMGRSFAQLVPMISGGSAALDKYAEQSKKAGEVTDENAKKLDELADRWEGLKVTVGVATANIIAKVAEAVTNLDSQIVRLVAWADKADAAIAGGLNRMWQNAVGAFNKMVEGIGSAVSAGLAAAIDKAKGMVQALGDKFKWLWDVVVGHSYIPDMVEGIGRSMAELQRVMVDPGVKATEKVGAAFQSLSGIVGSLFGQKAGGFLSTLGQMASVLGPLIGGGAPKPTGYSSMGIPDYTKYPSGMAAVTRVIVDTSPLLLGKIVQGDQSAAMAGAAAGQAGIMQSQKRRFP